MEDARREESEGKRKKGSVRESKKEGEKGKIEEGKMSQMG